MAGRCNCKKDGCQWCKFNACISNDIRNSIGNSTCPQITNVLQGLCTVFDEVKNIDISDIGGLTNTLQIFQAQLDNAVELIGVTCSTSFNTVFEGLCIIDENTSTTIEQLDNVVELLGVTCSTSFSTIFEGLCQIEKNTSNITIDGIGQCTDQGCSCSVFGILNLIAGSLIQGIPNPTVASYGNPTLTLQFNVFDMGYPGTLYINVTISGPTSDTAPGMISISNLPLQPNSINNVITASFSNLPSGSYIVSVQFYCDFNKTMLIGTIRQWTFNVGQ